MLFLNIIYVTYVIPGTAAATAAGIALALFYIYFNIAPRREKTQQYRLRLLIGGYELVLSAFSCFLFEALAYLFVLVKGTEIGVHILIINIFVCAGLLFVLLFNGIIRIFTCSEQLGIVPRISFLMWDTGS